MNPLVVIVGPPASGKKELAVGLLRLAASRIGGDPTLVTPDDLTPVADCAPGSRAAVLRLATKYYTADVELRVLPAAAFADEGSAAWDDVIARAEAAILIVDATAPLEANSVGDAPAAPSTLALASAWAGRLATAGTLLCVSSKCDLAAGIIPGALERPLPATYGTAGGGAPSADAEEDGGEGEEALPLSTAVPVPATHRAYLARISAWALDAGFEHIEAASTAPLVGRAAREKASIPRVLEALETTMWSNMQQQSRSRGGDSAVPPAGGATDTEGATAAAAAAAPSVLSASGGGDSAVDAPILEGVKEGPEGVEAALAAMMRAARGRSGGGAGDEEGGGGLPDVGELMAQMRAVREAAVGGGLSDEARREAAARMALRFLSMLEGGESEE